MSSESDEIALDDICSRFRMDDALGLLHGIYHVIAEVYRMNSDRHDPSVGDDMATFAQLVYRNSWAQLELALPLLDHGVWTSRPNNSLVINTPGPKLKVYRGGSDETFDIELYDFDTGSITKQTFALRNEQQLSLFDQDENIEFEGDRRLLPDGWVLVHSGNPDDGLLNVWIGAPKTATLTAESPWSFVFHLPDLCAQHGCGGSERVAGVSVEPGPFNPTGPSYDMLPEPEILIQPKSEHG